MMLELWVPMVPQLARPLEWPLEQSPLEQ